MSDPQRSNITRIAQLLGAFDARNTPRRSRDLLQEAGISQATGFGLLRALVAAGWLERVDHGLFCLGARAAGLMFAPIEPRIALGEQPVQVVAVRSTPGGEPAAMLFRDNWRPDLATSVPTQQFAIDHPARIGFANASLSNPWRRALLSSMQYAVSRNADRIEMFDVMTADDDPAQQIGQIERLIQAGIDLLIVSCPNVNSAPLNSRLSELAKAGLPILAVDRRPSDPSCLVSFVTSSDSRIGRTSAIWLVERLKPGARVWMLSGVEGASPAIRRQAAALAVLSSSPNVMVEAVASTDWTAEGGYAAVDRLLEQAGRAPDAVWCDSGLQGLGSIRRFLSQGGTIPVHTGGDLNGMYKLALHHKLPFVAVDYPAAMGARAVEIALDILSGTPVPRRVEVQAPVIMPRGMETPSVRADFWAEMHVRWDLPDDAILSQGPSLSNRKTQSQVGKL
ncbi:MAG TPA: substrate-binding domain-containing protein [Devosiaceae bacterium]